MHDELYLIAAILTTLLSTILLALSLDAHWRQVAEAKTALTKTQTLLLRVFGYSGLIVSLVFCFLADNPSMAILVWIMLLAVGAAVTASTLAWKAHWLKPISQLFKPYGQ